MIKREIRVWNGKRRGEHERLRWPRWGKVIREEQEKSYFN